MGTVEEDSYILDLNNISLKDTDITGSKAANLGDLARAGFPVPEGFVVTTRVFERFMEANGLGPGSSSADVEAATVPEADINKITGSNPLRSTRIALFFRYILRRGTIGKHYIGSIK